MIKQVSQKEQSEHIHLMETDGGICDFTDTYNKSHSVQKRSFCVWGACIAFTLQTISKRIKYFVVV